MQQIYDLLALPLGKCMAKGNWESHVYELGTQWVYKEIKQPNSIDKTVDNYESRQLLQKFWNSEVHFDNMVNDYKAFKMNYPGAEPSTHYGFAFVSSGYLGVLRTRYEKPTVSQTLP